MVAIYGDREAMRYVGDSEPLNAEGCAYWVEVTDRNFSMRGYGMIALADRESGEVIGCAGIVHPGQQEEAEVKYAFRSDCWGKGYATEAVSGLIKFARECWDVGRIIATTHPGNNASERVLAKVGFTHRRDRVNEDQTITRVWELP